MALQLRRGRTSSLGKTIAAAFAAIALTIQPFISSNIPAAFAAADSTVVVRGNDSSAYQSVSGWALNRDSANRTPIKFVAGNASTGIGALYVEPLSATVAARKFIAESTVAKPVADVQSIAFDYKLGPATNANQVYMNVYAKYPGTSIFYSHDCRYTAVASSGSSSGYSTLTLNTASSYSVTTRSGAAACPATPANMPSGSTITTYAINLGDTSPSDANMSAYFDNAVVTTAAGSVAYDFEPIIPAVPTGLDYASADQTCGGTTNVNFAQPTWGAVAGAASYDYQALYNGAVVYSTNFATNQHPGGAFGGGQNGIWGFQVRTVAANGVKSAWSPVCSITLDTVAPAKPVHEFPADNTVINYNSFYFDWSDVAGASSYEVQFSQNSSVGSDGALNVGVWAGDSSHNQPSDSRAWSAGANGAWYWQVRAVDAAGNKSAWTTPWKLTIDMQAPTTPEITAPTAGQEFPGTPGTIRAAWTAATDPSGITKYQIEYVYTRNGVLTTDYRDVAGNRLYRDQSLSGSVLSDFTIRVRAQDGAGNWSDWSAPVTYYYGVSGPVVDDGDDEEETPEEQPTEPITPTAPVSPIIPTTPVLTPEKEDTTDSDEPQQIFTRPLIASSNGVILGAQDDQSTTSTDTSGLTGQNVKGTQDIKGAETSAQAGIAGFAWYWWLLILAAIASFIWWLVAWRRRQSDDN